MTIQVPAPFATELGPLIRVHRAGADTWAALVAGVLLVLSGIVTVATVNKGQPWWSATLLAAGVLLLAVWWRKKDDEVRLHEGGFLYRHAGERHVVCWYDISHVWQRSVTRSVNFIPVGTLHQYTIQSTKGVFTFKSDIAEVRELGAVLQRHVLEAQLPGAIGAYNRGETVHFGEICLSMEGVGHLDRLLPWEKVSSVDLLEGYVRISETGAWFLWAHVAVSDVANFLVVWTLSRHVLRARGGA